MEGLFDSEPVMQRYRGAGPDGGWRWGIWSTGLFLAPMLVFLAMLPPPFPGSCNPSARMPLLWMEVKSP